MEPGTWQDVRVLYTRTGPTKYISHLDMNRTMQRAIARAHLPVWYTQGYNPHIYLTFALPTPLGYESLCETMDFRLVEELSPEEVVTRLNACLPAGIRAIRMAPPVKTAEDITAAEYRVTLSAPGKGARELGEALEAFFQRDSILTEKKTKKGTKEIDLKPHLRILEQGTAEDGSVLLILRLAAGSALNINPTLLFDAFSTLTGIELDCIRVIKQQVFMQNGGMEEPFA